MPAFVAVGSASPGLKVNAVDLSDHVRTLSVKMEAEDVDLTAMGAVSRTHAPGLRDDEISGTFFQDYASAKVDATLSALVGGAAGCTVIAYANGVTASATAPSYTMVGVLLAYDPIDTEIGSASMTPFSFKPAPGSFITRGTA